MRLLPVVALLLPAAAHADTFVVAPFLQDVTATSARLVWETDTDADAVVAWGAGRDATTLPESATADRRATSDGTWIHEVQLTGLAPESAYAYRVVLDDGTAAEADLRTAPASRGDRTFRLVAMSDMQRTWSAPEKWAEVVQDGVLAWARAQWGDDVASQLAMVLLPGDLVDDGWDHDQWIEAFFEPVAPLAARVPLYPVLGNHESNADWYFDYFHLPETGDPTRPDQWWSHAYENVLVVGLDSNAYLLWADQMTWLDGELARACDDPEVDFVLAELHHPWQSEPWVPGESPLTGQLVDRLAAFSVACDKPSVHLFGHTHAYSRGQLRDASHLMVNVATGGGAIDRWGEHRQRAYDAFTVSSDDWGFVVIDVASGDDPTLRVRRFSRGDAVAPLDNVQTDELVVRRFAEPPAAPVPLAPFGEVDGGCVTLAADAFDDPDGEAHQATHWQLVAGCDPDDPAAFAVPTHDRWVQDRDLWFDVDRQAGDDLTDEVVRGLAPGPWCWRARYRDAGLAWSAWSEPVAFTVTGTARSDELLVDPDGLADLDGWTVVTGTVEATGVARCGAPPPFRGARALAVGGRCAPEPETTVETVATLPERPAGDVAHLALAARGDVPLDVGLRFADADGAPVGDAWDVVVEPAGAWTTHAWEAPVPEGAVTARVVLHAVGTVDVDAVELSVGASGPLDCALARAPELEPTPDDAAACGCRTGPGLVALAPLLLALPRRRRR